jgi:two-component system nitrate/nitrite sensor histidine kinase NarX
VPPDSVHVGLGIMRERAQRIGAVVQVHSHAGQGTRVCIELPSSPRPPTPAPALGAVPAQVPAPAAPAVHQELLT